MNCLLIVTLVIVLSLLAVTVYKHHEASLLNKKESFDNAPIDYILNTHDRYLGEVCSSPPKRINTNSVEEDNQIAPSHGAPINYNMSANANSNYVDYSEPAPMNFKIGKYDKIRLNTDLHQNRRILTPGIKGDQVTNNVTNCDWRHAPCNLPLMGKNEFYTPDGKTEILKDDITTPYLPSVNGNPNGPRKMFMLAYNQCRPECCPSTYSCDHGCVCTNKQQREYLAKRGVIHQ